MATLSSFRAAVQAQLAAALGIAFVAGRLEGPIQGRDLGCVFPAAVAEVSPNVSEETLELRARVFKRFQQQLDAETPVDPAPLEALAEQIQAAIKAVETTLGPWFARVTRVDIDTQRQSVEAVIVGFGSNIGV